MSSYSIESYQKYDNKVQFMREQLKDACVGSLELQKRIYALYVCGLTLFRKFYTDSSRITTKVMQQMGRSARKVDSRFGLTVTMLSAFRHFCVLVREQDTEEHVWTAARANLVELLEYAIDCPEMLPTRHDYMRPRFDEYGLLYKEELELVLVPKAPEIVSAMTKNFAERLDKLIDKFEMSEDILEYVTFAHQFAVHLHRANRLIPESRLEGVRQQIRRHFSGEVEYENGKVPRLPSQDLIESVYVSCITQFRVGDQDHTVGQDMFRRIYDLHDCITKQVIKPDLSKPDYIRYLLNVAVLSTQSEYKIKYATDFWPEFRFKELHLQDVYYLINQEWKLFNSEWQLPKSEYKHHVIQLH